MASESKKNKLKNSYLVGSALKNKGARLKREQFYTAAERHVGRSLLPSELDELRAEQPAAERLLTYSSDPSLTDRVDDHLNGLSDRNLRRLRRAAGLREADCPFENMRDHRWCEWPDQVRERFAPLLVHLVPASE